MSIVENMQEIQCCILVDVLSQLRIHEIPGTADIGVRNVDSGVKIRERCKGDLTVVVVVGSVNVLVRPFVCG